jgi:hypothetical protein
MLIRGIIEGKSQAQAGREAFYASAQSANEAYTSIRGRMISAMEANGLTPELLAQRLRAKLDAQETKFFQSNGNVTEAIDVEAHGIQLKAAELAADLYGLRSESKSVSVGTVNIMLGDAVPWMQGPASASPDANTITLPDSNQTLSDRIRNQSVIAEPPPEVQLKVLSSGLAAAALTHHLNLGGQDVSIHRAAGLGSSCHRRASRQPRLPVFRGRK